MTIERQPDGSRPAPVEGRPRPAASSDKRWGVRTNGSTTALRILGVENDVAISMLLLDPLSGMGHVCVATEAGAVAGAFRYRPDPMIPDEQMGDGCGITALDEILRAGPMPHPFARAIQQAVGEPR